MPATKKTQSRYLESAIAKGGRTLAKRVSKTGG